MAIRILALVFKVTVRIIFIALLGELMIQVAMRWISDTKPVPLLFYAGMTAALLPFVPFSDRFREEQAARPTQQLAAIAALFGVVCANALLVSVTNDVSWTVGRFSLVTFPLWYGVIVSILLLRQRRRNRAN